MGRIQTAYEQKFRSLLRQANARRLEEGVRRLLARAERTSRDAALPFAQALAAVDRQTRHKLEPWLRRSGRRRPRPLFAAGPDDPPRFVCDAGMGGLARWLRAAGYEAHWRPDIGDDEALRETRRLGAILVTTDSMLMERRLVRDGLIPAVWVPPALDLAEQLAQVLDELGLPLRPSRCMHCGGRLQAVDKEAVRERIPPRTWRWLDEYFVCDQCGRLFWHGTHWQRIQAALTKAQERLRR